MIKVTIFITWQIEKSKRKVYSSKSNKNLCLLYNRLAFFNFLIVTIGGWGLRAVWSRKVVHSKIFSLYVYFSKFRCINHISVETKWKDCGWLRVVCFIMRNCLSYIWITKYIVSVIESFRFIDPFALPLNAVRWIHLVNQIWWLDTLAREFLHKKFLNKSVSDHYFNIQKNLKIIILFIF